MWGKKEENMICGHCGKTIPDTTKFCPYCGRKQLPVAATAAPEQVAPAPAPVNPPAASAPIPQLQMDPVPPAPPAPPAGNQGTVGNQAGGMTLRREGNIETFLAFTGRLNRKRYIKRSLGLCGLCILFILVPLIMLGASLSGDSVIGVLLSMGTMFAAYFGMGAAFLVIGGISLNMRRIHDLGMAEYWITLIALPLVNFFFSLYLLFAKGTDGDNQYGPDPLKLGYGYVLTWQLGASGVGTVGGAGGAVAAGGAAGAAGTKGMAATFQKLPKKQKIIIGGAAVLILLLLLTNVFSNKKKTTAYKPYSAPKQTAPAKPGNQKKTAPAPKAPAKQQVKYGRITGEDVRMRDMATTSSRVLDYFDKGEEVTVLGSKNGWYRVKRKNGQQGWVSSQFCMILNRD